MRPLIIDLGRDYRGGQQQALLLLQGLLQRGHNPHLLTVADSGLAKDAQSAGIPTTVVSAASRQFRSASTIRDLLAEHKSDIVHANEPHALTAAWIARVHRRLPLIAARRVIFSLSRSPISLARYRAAARIIAVSQCVGNALPASGLSADRIAVIPDGVRVPELRLEDRDKIKLSTRQNLGIAPDVPLVGNVAAFTPDKGQAFLVRALSMLRSTIPGCQLLLAGNGPCRPEVEALVAKSGLTGAVHFVGYVDDIGRVYQALDVFAFPAQAEALGTALLLAMAHALPCVALARGGVPEAVQDDVTGVLIDEQESSKLPAALANGIERLLSNPADARRFGNASRELICRKFSVDRMVEATLELYEGLIASSKKKARSAEGS